MAYTGTTGENGLPLYRCECGNVFELDPNSTRCTCKCHEPALAKARELGTYCEECGFASLSPETFRAHFNWGTHQKAVVRNQETGKLDKKKK